MYIHTHILFNPTPKPTHHSDLSAFLYFQSFCIIYKLVSSWGPKQIFPKGEFTGITVGTFGPRNEGKTSTQTHTACKIFIFYDEVHSNLKSVSTVPTLPTCIFLKNEM